MNAFGIFNRLCRKGLIFAGIALLFMFVAVVLLQVVARNLLKIPLDWTTEVSVFCFVWSVFLGAAVAVSTRRHYVIDLFPPEYRRINMALILLADLLIMAVIGTLIWGGWKFALLGWKRLSVALEIRRFWLFVSLPLSGLFMFTFNLENFFADARHLLDECRKELS